MGSNKMKKDTDLKWFDLNKFLLKADKKELINVIQDLYRNSKDNRRYLLARFIDREETPIILEEYREIIKNEFFPKKGYGALRYSVAEKAIKDYSEASRDFTGKMELMLTYVENGVEYTNEYGDIDEEFYDKIYEMLEQFCVLLKTPEGQLIYPFFRERLFKIRDDSEEIAWGFGDAVDILISKIEDLYEEEQSDS
jgi:hypothetical protein